MTDQHVDRFTRRDPTDKPLSPFEQLTDTEPWMTDAHCAQVEDPDIFFPPSGTINGTAQSICATCPVQIDCLRYAMANPDLRGIWGGISERERNKRRGPKYAAGPTARICELIECDVPISIYARPNTRFCTAKHANRQRARIHAQSNAS